MTKIPSEDYQNAKNYPRMFLPADDQDKGGFKLEDAGSTLSSFAVARQ